MVEQKAGVHRQPLGDIAVHEQPSANGVEGVVAARGGVAVGVPGIAGDIEAGIQHQVDQCG